VDKFANLMAKGMGKEKGMYRNLGEAIFLALAEQHGAPLPRGKDICQAIARMESTIRDDNALLTIVKKLRPKFEIDKQQAAVLAFRQAYLQGHFQEMLSAFST
jgi:hypothetical protein